MLMNRKTGLLWMLLLFVSGGVMAQRAELEQGLLESMREGDRAVVVAVHVGADDAAEQLCIDRFNAKMREAFPSCDFREAWTSRDKIGRLEQNGIGFMPTPDALLTQLHKEGYTHVLMQSSDVVNGVEMQYLRQVAEGASGMFNQLRVGEPLLSDVDDYEKVFAATAAAFGKEKEVNVLVCREQGETDAQYALLDYTMKDGNQGDWLVGTTEGYPSFDSVVRQLKRQKLKKVNLIPFVFTAADGMAEEWKQRLQQAGYKVTAELRALGEVDGILNIFVQHLRHAEQFRTLSPKERMWIVR